MKRIILAIFFALFVTTATFSQTLSPKRGISRQLRSQTDLNSVYKGASWYYNWDVAPHTSIAEDVGEYIEYVPMIWGSQFDKIKMIAYLDNHPETKYILGFNEPII
ncbi:MAG: hypothetical protein H7259_09230 [Cytophagales bacterium]|nr:hypothetical protein [Cytophaga sp.]